MYVLRVLPTGRLWSGKILPDINLCIPRKPWKPQSERSVTLHDACRLDTLHLPRTFLSSTVFLCGASIKSEPPNQQVRYVSTIDYQFLVFVVCFYINRFAMVV